MRTQFHKLKLSLNQVPRVYCIQTVNHVNGTVEMFLLMVQV